jgi:hypothetical protein
MHDDLSDLAKPSRESLREVRREARRRPRGGPRHDPGNGRRSGGSRWPVVAVLLVIVVVVGAVVAAGVLVTRTVPTRAAAATGPTPDPTESGAPSAAATKAPDPFARTRVVGWGTGAAGIKVPAAKPVGSFTAAQVGHAYARTATYLRAALLDPHVLYADALAPVEATLRPDTVRSRHDDPTSIANRFPHSVVSASPTIRVTGVMKAKVGADGRLQVTFTYIGAYAVRPAKGGDVELVAVRRTGTLEYLVRDPAHVGLPWVYQDGTTNDHSVCGSKWPDKAHLEVVLGPQVSEPPAAPTTPLPDFDLLDPNAPEPTSCFNEDRI